MDYGLCFRQDIESASALLNDTVLHLARPPKFTLWGFAWRRVHLAPEIVIDYRRERFEDALRDYDIVFDTMAGETQLRSFGALRRGGVLVTIAGMPSAKYIRESGLNPLLAWAMAWMNRKATRLAKKHAVRFEYLFMRPDGLQLAEIAKLLEAGVIKPVIDKVYPLDQAKDALAYSESGHATGKVVIRV